LGDVRNLSRRRDAKGLLELMEKRVGKGRTRISKDSPGFTFVELVVVLFVLGFIFLLTFPNFRELLEPRDIKRATVRLVGSMRYAQSQAATTKQRFRLNIDLKYSLYISNWALWSPFLHQSIYS
jgi:Tfp pilus assembly protein FimT